MALNSFDGSAHMFVPRWLIDLFRDSKNAQLGQNHRAGRIAVEGFNLAVFQAKHVAARRVHPFARRWYGSQGQFQRSVLRSL